MTAASLYQNYLDTMRKHADVEHTLALLHWDKEINLPSKGNAFRAQQLATLSGIAHEIITSPELGETLEQLDSQRDKLEAIESRNIKLSLKAYRKTQKFSKDFVIRRSNVISKAYDAWLKAREANDFSLYQEALNEMVALKKEEAELIGYEDHPYDALLDEYEPNAKTADLVSLFKEVESQLVDFVREIRAYPQLKDSFLHQQFDGNKQWQFGLDLLKNMGYDFEAGRQDKSPHPFTTTFSPKDVRVTTRIDEQFFGSMTWSCIHEGGHALYEQGLPAKSYGLPSGKACSLGIHESQSRLWENNVGRGLPYWKAHYPQLQQTFPDALGAVPLEQFYKGINKIAPSLIRTESDELHYHFHILIRFEIEKGLLEGRYASNDLKEVWNDRYKAYLDLDVPDDRSGILQDIHWAYGNFGYFPTYSLGSFYAAQFYHQAQSDLPDLEHQIAMGNNVPLLEWLRNHIHQYGQYYSAEELCERITGEKLNFKYFMDYVKSKFKLIYN
ncbi:MAG: carboxypeptidase M32 [Bacteroidota bacterium]